MVEFLAVVLWLYNCVRVCVWHMVLPRLGWIRWLSFVSDGSTVRFYVKVWVWVKFHGPGGERGGGGGWGLCGEKTETAKTDS